jgi:hypothetical protein
LSDALKCGQLICNIQDCGGAAVALHSLLSRGRCCGNCL